MTVQSQVEVKIRERFSPIFLEVINESSHHNVPPGSESHFKVIVVSEQFEGKMLVDRHRAINETLAQELKEGIHALSLHAFTHAEWEKKSKQSSQSPDCMGG